MSLRRTHFLGLTTIQIERGRYKYLVTLAGFWNTQKTHSHVKTPTKNTKIPLGKNWVFPRCFQPFHLPLANSTPFDFVTFQFGRVQQRLIFQELLLSFRRPLHLSRWSQNGEKTEFSELRMAGSGKVFCVCFAWLKNIG